MTTSLELSRLSHGQFQSDLGATSKTWHHRVLEYFCTQKISLFIRQDSCWICNDMTLLSVLTTLLKLSVFFGSEGGIHPGQAAAASSQPPSLTILNSTTTLSRLQRHSGDLIPHLFGYCYCAVSCTRQVIPNVQSTSCLITDRMYSEYLIVSKGRVISRGILYRLQDTLTHRWYEVSRSSCKAILFNSEYSIQLPISHRNVLSPPFQSTLPRAETIITSSK